MLLGALTVRLTLRRTMLCLILTLWLLKDGPSMTLLTMLSVSVMLFVSMCVQQVAMLCEAQVPTQLFMLLTVLVTRSVSCCVAFPNVTRLRKRVTLPRLMCLLCLLVLI